MGDKFTDRSRGLGRGKISQMISKVEHALNLAKIGFHVFPLHANSKLPFIEGFPTRATTDEKQIRKWWEMNSHFNIGISTSSFNGGKSALIAVDVDNKGDKKGSDELLRLELEEGFVLPKTFTQTTPTGGLHYIYLNDVAMKQGVNVLGNGLDIRSSGGYLVGHGSTIDGKDYAADFGPLAKTPDELRKKLSVKIEKEKIKVDTSKINSDRAKKRAVEYLEDKAPLAEEGKGGDQTTFTVAARLKDLGLSPEDTLELLLNHWNQHCSPPWDERELQEKIEHAHKYGENPIGSAAPEVQFDDIPKEEQTVVPEIIEDKNSFYLDDINKEFALVTIGGKYTVLRETKDSEGYPDTRFMDIASFKIHFAPNLVQLTERGKPLTYAEVWLGWEGRRRYDGICFEPELDNNFGFYNTWRGFTCQPVSYQNSNLLAKTGFDAFMDHALNNVCSGDEKLFRWLMGYFAHMVQKPFERPLTTLVFQGSKGVGKNALIDRVGSLLDNRNYLVAYNSRFLTSNFNGHLDSCLMLVLDEAFWSGDKTAEGALKSLTTSPHILIERKGSEPYKVKNFVRMVIIGNEPWLVNASADERRYAIFKVGEGRKQDNQFFHGMRVNLDEKGGRAILLDYLKNFDLKTVDVNRAPKTEGLLEQKVNSLDPVQQWWFDCLSSGQVPNASVAEGWPEKVSKEDLKRSLSHHMRERNVRSRVPTTTAFTQQMKKFGEIDVRHKVKTDSNGWSHAYTIPPLKEARAQWDEYLGGKTDWESDS